MTVVVERAGSARRDWKVTTAHRVMVRLGWTAMTLAVYGIAVAVVVGIESAWWLAAGMAAVALLTGVLTPAPVPRELITGGRNHIDARRPTSG